jgi:acetyl esterase
MFQVATLACCLTTGLPDIARISSGPVRAASQASAKRGTSEAQCLPATPTNPDGNYIVPRAAGAIVYREVGGQRLALDAYAPALPAPRAPVVVIHGGGYSSGSRVSFVGQLLELLGDAQIPFVSVDYRLGGPGREADAVDDVRAAVAFVRCHARTFGIDADGIVLLGEDTGADIALALADAGTPGVAAAALVGARFREQTPGSGQGSGRSGATPSGRAAGPSLLFIHGTSDSEQPIDSVRTMCTGRRESGDPCEVVAVEDGIHRAENWRPDQWGYKTRLVAWLDGLAAEPARGRDGTARAPAAGAPALAERFAAGLHKRIPFDAANGLTLDAWLPPAGARPAPAALLVHGGGWEAGDRVTYITPLFEPLARAGVAWFSIDYRLTPAVRHPAQMEDLRTAVRFVRRHAGRFGVDGRRLVLVGESASGQMATLLAAEDSDLGGVVSFYGVYDFAPMVPDASPRSLAARLFGRTALDEETRGLLRKYSPLHAAHGRMPPMLLVHGTNERLWEQGVAMADRLRTLGVAHELLRLDGAPHGMENWEGRPEWAHYKAKVVEWITGN